MVVEFVLEHIFESVVLLLGVLFLGAYFLRLAHKQILFWD